MPGLSRSNDHRKSLEYLLLKQFSGTKYIWSLELPRIYLEYFGLVAVLVGE